MNRPAKSRRVLAWSTAVLTVAAGALTGSVAPASARLDATLISHHSFGTIARGGTVCVGPLSPTADPTGGTPGVQISGFTNGSSNLTWQVFSGSSQSAPTRVFQTSARFVDHTVPPEGNLLYHACVVKSSGSTQDYDLTLNSFPVE
ncbi:hypothetical protein [Couchioplanes azureus]|uniref:hypothetical protein n=1 Tax=Couchioplanes caeruleus TaxID=56438 RepID=UPI0016712AC6|nr:hypothetical protein [Couchioplanes caeruleus]GGQ74309.1 hypothetical protein GCM10010166_50660 [Couchioplanes caeruleus subsp. azureus]